MTGPMQGLTKAGLTDSIYDGVLSNMFATLTGGVFLMGFAVYLGMNEFTIGLLGAMPFLVTVFQLPAAHFVQQRGNRKKVSVRCSLAARTMWVLILAVALLPVPGASVRIPIVLTLIFLQYALGSASFVAWLSWMSDLVPDRMRGTFFGTRNMLAGAASMAVMVIFGTMLDGLKTLSPKGVSLGFSITILAAVSFGVASIHFLRRIPEPANRSVAVLADPAGGVLVPLRDRGFRRFLSFSFFWGFSVFFAAPFFPLYFLRDLGFGYGFIATLGMLSAFADLVGMRLWGKLSDTTRNKPIIYFGGWGAVFLPLAWVFVRPESLVLPILLHMLGGGMWSGINLCANNLVLRISPSAQRALYVSVYNVVGGLGAALGPILAGLLLQNLGEGPLPLSSRTVLPLHALFVVSTLLRLLSLQLLRRVEEPQEVTVVQMLRIIRSVRGLNMTNGFNFLLHPFVNASDAILEDRRKEDRGMSPEADPGEGGEA
jgi:MFS family permease